MNRYGVIRPSADTQTLLLSGRIMWGLLIFGVAIVLGVVFLMVRLKQKKRQRRVEHFLQEHRHTLQQTTLSKVLASEGKDFFQRLIAYCEYFVHQGIYESTDDLLQDLGLSSTTRHHIAKVLSEEELASQKIISSIKSIIR